MAETARFYWFGGEATLPISATAEQAPLQILESDVGAHTPEVIQQLQAGQFVAVAWPSGETIHMTLCYPASPRGGRLPWLLNTAAPPWPVLNLRDWTEAPEAARLLRLTYGTEAAHLQEYRVAREQLIRWLEAHGQPDVALAVRRFPELPFGFRPDALDAISVWRHLLVQGRKERVDSFVDGVGRRFATLGWSREEVYEQRLNRHPHQLNRFACWGSGHGGAFRLLLSLNRVAERRVRGGPVDVLEGHPDLTDVAPEIQRVLMHVIHPAAADAGLEVSYPRLGPVSRVGAETTAAMTALAESASGRWPLPGDLARLWVTFVITAVREEVAIKPEELHGWFVASGWTPGQAADMTDRFYADAAVLREYEDAKG